MGKTEIQETLDPEERRGTQASQEEQVHLVSREHQPTSLL
jgi:hypothetical protein